MVRNILAFIFFVAAFQASGQGEEIRFYAVSNGLSQHSVSSILQDSKGLMWIATRHGLNRYDGVTFVTYAHINGDTSTISNSTIQCLAEDDKGNIWIGTYGGGLNYYNYEKDDFVVYKHDRSIPTTLSDDFISAVFEDYEGNTWVGTEKGGLNLLDKEKGTFTRYLSNEADPFSITSNNVTALNEDKNGNLWIGTYGGGVSLFDKNKQHFISFRHETTPGLESDVIRSIYRLSNGEFLVGTHQGIKKLVYNNGKYTFKNLLPDSSPLSEALNSVRILSICEDAQARVWVGTENEGLFMVDREKGTAQHFTQSAENKYGLNSNSIWSLYADRYGTVWVGTYDQGLSKIDPYEEKFDGLYQRGLSEQSLSHNVVSAFAEDEEGNIWVGTDGGGLNHFNRKTKKFTRRYKHSPDQRGSLANDAVVSLVTDDGGDLWIGTWEEGICIKPKGKEVFRQIKHDPSNSNSPSGNDIYKLYKDTRGSIWIGAFRDGLDVYDPKRQQFHHFKHDPDNKQSISGNKVRSIIEDHLGYLWVGTEGAGLNRLRIDDDFRIQEITHYTADAIDGSGLPNNTITYIFEDSDHELWIGTEGGGIGRYNREKDRFTLIPDSQGLQNNVIYALLEDEEKNLWISTNNGLACYNKSTGVIKTYNESDGLQSSEFYKSSCLRTRDCYLLFGGIKGFNMFKPGQVEKNPHQPAVYITNFLLSNRPVKPGANSPIKKNILDARQVSLDYNQNDFTLEFAALNFSQSSKNEYAYKLENYDDEWQEVGTRNKAFYANVPPGHYTFRVKGSNNDGVWNDEGTAISIAIAGPWYSTWWAYVLYASVVIGMLLWAVRTIIYKERLQAELQVEHMELTKMQEMDQLKSRFFANISHEFRTPLTLIISPLKSLYLDETKNEYKKQIKMMIRNAERLLRLINQILDLSQLESGSMKLKAIRQDLLKFLKPLAFSFAGYADKQFITYRTTFPKTPVYLYFEKDKLEKVLINLLSNAIKYTPEFGEVSLTVQPKKEHVEIIISDTGIGIPRDQIELIFNRFYRVNQRDSAKGTGIGLALTKELVELHNGKIEVASAEGKGTTFRVQLPVGGQHLDASEIVEEGVTREAHTDHLIDETIPGEESAESLRKEQEDDSAPLVLIAEDNEEMRSFISSYLEAQYRIIACSNGKEAFDHARRQIPEIIISDVMMPEMDGYELCSALKNDENTSHIPVILLTAKASNESIEQGFELGANYYVTKPFNPRLLELRVKNILESRKKFREQVLNNKTLNIEPSPVAISSADESFIKKAIGFVEENMDNSAFQVEDLCQSLGMSKIQLYRKLKGLIGQSANEFIRTIRLKRAAQLIKQQQLTIAEITYQVGFNDLQYFRHCFKKQYGVNPSEFVQE